MKMEVNDTLPPHGCSSMSFNIYAWIWVKVNARVKTQESNIIKGLTPNQQSNKHNLRINIKNKNLIL